VDKAFDDIITEVKWKEHKDEEEAIRNENKKNLAAFNIEMAQYNLSDGSSEKPKLKMKDLKIYTTCIDLQRNLLEKALIASGISVRKVMQYDDKGVLLKDKPKAKTYAYGTLGPQQAKVLNAWNEASVGMKKRPQPRDTLV